MTYGPRAVRPIDLDRYSDASATRAAGRRCRRDPCSVCLLRAGRPAGQGTLSMPLDTPHPRAANPDAGVSVGIASPGSEPGAIVCFSHLRWGFVWQRPQHLLSRFATEMPVFVVEEPEFVPADDAHRLRIESACRRHRDHPAVAPRRRARWGFNEVTNPAVGALLAPFFADAGLLTGRPPAARLVLHPDGAGRGPSRLRSRARRLRRDGRAGQLPRRSGNPARARGRPPRPDRSPLHRGTESLRGAARAAPRRALLPVRRRRGPLCPRPRRHGGGPRIGRCRPPDRRILWGHRRAARHRPPRRHRRSAAGLDAGHDRSGRQDRR